MIATGRSISHGMAKANYDENKMIDGIKVSSEAARHEVFGDNGHEVVLEMKEVQQSFFPNVKKPFFDFIITLSEADAEKITTPEQSKDLVEKMMSELMLDQLHLTRTEYERMQWIAYQHERTDNNSKLKHWHILCNRVLLDGKIVPDFYIGKKISLVANNMSKEMGFSNAQEISVRNKKEIKDTTISVLKSMDKWNFEKFKNKMAASGIVIREARSAGGKLNGYYFKAKSGTEYKASEIDRRFTLSRLEGTYNSLHPKERKKISFHHTAPSSNHSHAHINVGALFPKFTNGSNASFSNNPDAPSHKKRKSWDEMDEDEKREASRGY